MKWKLNQNKIWTKHKQTKIEYKTNQNYKKLNLS